MKKTLIIICVFGFALQCLGQSNTFFLNDWTGNSQWRYNPGVQSSEKFYLYLPVLGGFNSGIGHTGFSYNDAVKDNQVNVSNLLEELDFENHFMSSVNSDLFAFGVKSGKIQLRAGVRQNFETRLTYSKDMLELFWKGNGHPDVIGRRMSLNSTGINALAYLSYFAGISAELLPDQLTAGVNFNFYNGAGTVSTEKSLFGLTTDSDDYSITADGEFRMLTSGGSLYTDEVGAQRFLPFSVSGNTGFGIDFGFNFKASEKFEVEGSVLNLGKINWTEDIVNYELTKTEITYSGFDLEQLINSNDSSDVFTQFADSLTDSFIPFEGNSEFNTSTNSDVFFRGKYRISRRDELSFMFNNKESFGTNFQSIAGVYSREFGTSLKLSGGVHLFQGRDLLVPFGLVLNAGPFQFGAHTENILAVVKPLDSKYVSASFSLGIRLGKEKETEKSKAKEAKKEAKKKAKKDAKKAKKSKPKS